MKRCVPHRSELCLVHTFSNRHVCSWRHFLSYLYSRFSHFLIIITKKLFSILPTSSLLFFVRLFCKLSSSGSSDPYHFGGMRSVLSWETIVHYPRYKLRGQICLKDTTLSLGSDLLSNYCLYCMFVSFKFIFIVSGFLNEQKNYNLKTNFVFFFVSVYVRFFTQTFFSFYIKMFVFSTFAFC